MSNATVPEPGGTRSGTPYPSRNVRPRPSVPASYVPMWPGGRTPSGLFPSGRPRPAYREPFPARTPAIWAGAGATTVWMLLFGLVGRTARSYCWWSICAGVVGWLVALLLARAGDRGVAVGVAIASGAGVAIAMSVVLVHWIGGHWLLW